jgi:hypothetical protein
MLLFKRPYNAYFLFFCPLISIKKELFIIKHVQRVKNRQPALQNEIEGGPKPPLYYSILFLSFRHQRTDYFKELLVDAIKHVPSYAKFLKDLCIMKRKLNVKRKPF